MAGVSASDAIFAPFNAAQAYVYESAFADRLLWDVCCQLGSLWLSERPA